MYRLSTQNKPEIAKCMSLQHKIIGTKGNAMTHNPFTVWLYQFFSIQDILVFRLVNKFGFNWCESHLNLPLVRNVIKNELGPNFIKLFNMRLRRESIARSLTLMVGDFWDVHSCCPDGYYKQRGNFETFSLTRIIANGNTSFLEKQLFQV